MKTIVGYKFWIKFDNGDCDEWYRQTNIMSPLYTTRDLALKAFYLYLEKVEKDIKQETERYMEFQKQFEKDVVSFRKKCIARRDKKIEETTTLYRSKVTILPVYINDDATASDDIIRFNVAD